jgi:lipid-A-disaccharide synthase
MLTELRRLAPEVRPFGMGGEEMRKAGAEILTDFSEISVVGLSEVMKVLPRARHIFGRLLSEAERRDAPAAVLIDFAEFNLRLAERLHDRGMRVIYYISPQIWAWRRGRVKTIARVVDEMLVLFPFEVDFYRAHGVEVVNVGHPLVDEIAPRPQAWDAGPPDGPYRIALLPGSRPSEIEALLPTMLAAVARLAERLPIQVSLILAPTITRSLIAELEPALELGALRVSVVESERFDAIAASHLALCASGTATLEVGLLGTPMIVMYRLAKWTYRLARILVRVPHFSLVNLVLGRELVPELLQGQASPDEIARRAEALLRDPRAIAEMRRGLAELRGRLGATGGSRRAALEVARQLGLQEAPA